MWKNTLQPNSNNLKYVKTKNLTGIIVGVISNGCRIKGRRLLGWGRRLEHKKVSRARIFDTQGIDI